MTGGVARLRLNQFKQKGGRASTGARSGLRETSAAAPFGEDVRRQRLLRLGRILYDRDLYGLSDLRRGQSRNRA